MLLAMLGHAMLTTAVFNQLHARHIPRRLMKSLTWAELAFAILMPAALVGTFLRDRVSLGEFPSWLRDLPWPATLYVLACAATGICGSAWWLVLRARLGPPHNLRFDTARRLVDTGNLDRQAWLAEAHPLVRLPGNQILDPRLIERGIELESLSEDLDGLSIVHLSDFHFTGRIGKSYFRDLVDASNRLEPDLVAITGDLVDEAACLDWAPEIFSRLSSRLGVYFILGNHDLLIDSARLRSRLTSAGLVDLGGQWRQVLARGRPLLLAGNELPWFAPAAHWAKAPPRTAGGPLRIALAHSPDQLAWARANEVDLLLSGHTHGGQIRVPGVGALVSASRLGVHYADGTFYRAPTTLHVSRGVSGELPLRWFCPPEIVRLRLCARR